MTKDELDFVVKLSSRKPHEQRVSAPHSKPQYTGSPRPNPFRMPVYGQIAVVRINYAKPDRLQKHQAYLEREGKGPNASKPELFTEPGKQLPTGPIAGEQRFFRCMLSPSQDGSAIPDMQKFTQNFMDAVNQQRPTGHELQWFAAVHHNTGHPHAHIVLRGIDARGSQVTLDKDFITREARQIASRLATLEIGPRGLQEINAQRQRQIFSERFTALDRAIDSASRNGRVRPQTQHQKERLDFLSSKFQLASRNKNGSYQLAPTWKQQLQEIGKRNDVVKTLQGDLPPQVRAQWLARGQYKSLLIYQDSWQAPVHGKIVAKGALEHTDTPYVVVQSKGRPYYYTNRNIQLDKIHLGQEVTLNRGRLNADRTRPINQQIHRSDRPLNGPEL